MSQTLGGWIVNLRWNSATDSPHAYLGIGADARVVAGTIEGLMTQPLARQEGVIPQLRIARVVGERV